MRAFLLVLFFAALAGPRPAAAVDQQKYFRKHLDSLTGKQYWLREVVNSSPKVYCETDGVQTYFVHEYSPLYRLTRKVEVTVEELQYDEAYNLLLMIFRHRKMGCGAITFHWPENVTPSVRTLENMMRYAFSESGEADDFKTYVGNSLCRVQPPPSGTIQGGIRNSRGGRRKRVQAVQPVLCKLPPHSGL